MNTPLCDGFFQNTLYRFDNSAMIYKYDNTTFSSKVSPATIYEGADSEVVSIKKCICNGADTIYFIGTTNDDQGTNLYSATFDKNSHDLTFQRLQDPTNGYLNNNSTTMLAVDKWSGLNGCVMMGYNKNSFGVACPLKPVIKVNITNISSSTKNIFTTKNNQLHQLTAKGLNTFSFTKANDRLSYVSNVYKFQEPDIINANVTWKIVTSDDSSQALFYNTGPSLQLLKLDKGTQTANVIAYSFNNITSDSTVLFKNLNTLVIINPSAYQIVSIDQLERLNAFDKSVITSAPTSTIEPVKENSTSSKKIDAGLAVGFTFLGIFIGLLLAFLFLLSLKRFRRQREITSPRGINTTSIDSGAHVEEIVSPQLSEAKPVEAITPVIYTQNVARRPSFKAQLIPTNIGEGDPENSKYSSIFNNRCDVQPEIIGSVSTNPRHQGKVYTRECVFQDRTALIHYFNSDEGEKKFENAMFSLNSPLLKNDGQHIIEYLDAVQLKKTTSADKGFKFILITSFYETSQSLAALYTSFNSKNTVVDVLDETFIVYTIYSLLLAVRDLHAAGYVHRCLTADSFYTESNAPSTDWILADFDEAGLASTTYIIPPGKCEYYDALYNGKTFGFESDIWALGLLLFKVISGGQDVKMSTNTNYTDRIEQQVQNKVYCEQYRMLLQSTLCNTPFETRLTAKQLVEYWEDRFDFGEAD